MSGPDWRGMALRAVGWQQAVAADDKPVFLSDRLNRSAVRVNLTCAGQETCEIK